MIQDLNERTRQILRLVVDTYVATGSPVGSKLLSQMQGMTLSPATIRHAMAELEELGLLYAPHTSAGRLPTDHGMAVFVDGLLEVNEITAEDRMAIEEQFRQGKNRAVPDILEQTSKMLSGLSSCAGLVMAPKTEQPIKEIQFILLGPGRVLSVIVSAQGTVENRIFETASDITASRLEVAANYINARIANKTLSDAAMQIKQELNNHRLEMDTLTKKVIESGMASMAPLESGGHLFIKGQSTLLDDISALEDIERIQNLFDTLETKEIMLKLIDEAKDADGVRIFIGAQNSLFRHSGCAMIVAPYTNQEAKVVGAIGVVGPTRLNYGRLIPVVNYTSQMMSKIIT